MEITQSNLQSLRTTFSLQYRQAYSVAETFADKIGTRVPSGASTNTYGWLAQLPRMREWLGERTVNNLSEHSYVLSNKEYELTYAIKRRDILDDSIGVFGQHMAEMGTQVAKHADDLFKTLLRNGQNNLCFDGKAFFATDHPVNANNSAFSTYSNYSSSGMALTNDNYETQRQAMMAFKGDNGEPLGIVPDMLVVPPQLEAQGKRILTAEFLPAFASTATSNAPQTNVNKGTATLLMVPELAADATTWYLLCTKRAVRPFIHQVREAPIFQTRTDINGENVFKLNQFEFGAYTCDNAGYTLPFLAMKSIA